jgi:hypothetical protein
LITPDTPDWSARGRFKHGSNLNGNLCPYRVTSQRKSTPECLQALRVVVEQLQARRIVIPLSFSNIYETMKINDPVRRMHLANVQTTLSSGMVLRGRRRILEQTMSQHIADKLNIAVPPVELEWFLSGLWFEAAADYAPGRFGLPIPDGMLDWMRSNPRDALFEALVGHDEEHRAAGIRAYTASSMDLLARIQERRALAANESFAMRRRIYGARLAIDEIDFICNLGRRLGLNWQTPRDIGSRLLKSLVNDIPVMHTERELVLRLEDQDRMANENDLRDMGQFVTALALADVVVGEKPFVNMARQAGLGSKYGTELLTSVQELTDARLWLKAERNE